METHAWALISDRQGELYQLLEAKVQACLQLLLCWARCRRWSPCCRHARCLAATLCWPQVHEALCVVYESKHQQVAESFHENGGGPGG